MIIVSIVVVVLMLYSTCIKVPLIGSELYVSGYSKENTSALKGILSLCIVLCHMSNYVSQQLPFFRFSAMGSIGVGIFFFISGYALIVSTSENQNYLRHFLLKRMSKILVPYALCLLTYIVVNICLGGRTLETIAMSFGSGYPVSNTWYVWAIVYCYFIYWVAFHKFKNNYKKGLLNVGIGLFAWIIVMTKVLEWPDWWYKTVWIFEVGLLWGIFREQLKTFLKKNYLIVIIVAVIFAMISYFLPAIYNRIAIIQFKGLDIWLVNDVLMGISFTLLATLLLYKMSWKNKITSFLGEYCFEIYMYHGMIMEGLETIMSQKLLRPIVQELFGILTIVLTIVVSVFFRKVANRLLDKNFQRKNG